jgi:hypothetical protein
MGLYDRDYMRAPPGGSPGPAPGESRLVTFIRRRSSLLRRILVALSLLILLVWVIAIVLAHGGPAGR